jgi:hypothetical protein
MKLKLAILVLLTGAVTHAEQKSWRGKMRDVSNALSEVVPYLYPTSDKDPKALMDKVTKLHDATEKLDVKKDHIIKNGDFDPALIYFADSFKDDIDRAYLSLKKGYSDYARYTLINSTAYCIGCHTRTSSGTQFPLVQAFATSLKNAPWIARMEFLAATRQFDAAYDEIIKELGKPAGQSLNSLDLERGAKLGLSIAIRVKQDPNQALKLTEALKNSQNISPFTRETANNWQRDIQAWKEEKPKKYSSSLEMVKDAKKLIAKAQDSNGHGEVSFLRASALLHNLLKSYPRSREQSEAFYLLGLSYTRLQDLGLWNLQEMYFRACILEAPHSEMAEKCYQEFKESIIVGYSGSSGIHVPPDVQSQLQHLKKMAERSKSSR